MKLYVLTFTDVQTNEMQVEVYPTLKLAQIYMRGKCDDAIAASNTLDQIVSEDDYGCYVKDVCDITIDEVDMNWHDFIAHKIVEQICDRVTGANLYYDVIYNIVDGFETNEYPDIDNYEGVQNFIDYKLLNTMSFAAAKKLTDGVKLSYEKFNKVVIYLHDNVYICHLAKIINGEMITQYQIQYDTEHQTETLFNHKKVWAFSSNWWGGAHYAPNFTFRLFEKYDAAADALIAEKENVYHDFRSFYGEDEIIESLLEDPNSTTYEVYEKENHDDAWVGKVEVRYVE